MKYLTGERAMVRQPVSLKAAEKRKYARGPFLGEHSEEILKELGTRTSSSKRCTRRRSI
jgi:cinnamoyl-CoA:phenyllactate CoA-transferase